MKAFLRTVLAVMIANVLLLCAVALIAGLKMKKLPEVKSGSVLIQTIEGPIPEYAPPASALSFGEARPHQTMILENLEKARRDKRIRAVVLKLGMPEMGWAKQDELRERIAALRDAGKPVWAYLEFLDRRGLYLGCACDSLFLLKNGYVSLQGFRAERPFVKGALEKLGIKDNIHKIEKYKSAAEIVQRKDLSPEARQNIDWIFDATYPNFLRTVEEDRGLEPGELEAAVLSQGALTPHEALAAHIVDRLVYWDQVEASLMKVPGVKPAERKPKGLGPRPRMIDGAAYARIPREKAGIDGKKKIAVIHAQGLIQGERNGTSFPFGMTMGATTMEQAFRRAAEDKEVAAIIFRIDSGGGESSTSWKINRAAIRAGETKPLVVSMNDLAGSGAYLISYPCSTLVADRLSVVGSIGSISGKLNLHGFYDKLGITKDFVTRGPNAMMDSDYSDYSPEEWTAFTSRHWLDYQEWVDDIARYRGLTPAQVDSVGRGRVWTGEQALARGLIDTLGTFDVAVSIAKKKAGIPQDQDVRFVHYPKPPGPLEALRSGGAAAFALTIAEQVLSPFVREGTWAWDWNQYR